MQFDLYLESGHEVDVAFAYHPTKKLPPSLYGSSKRGIVSRGEKTIYIYIRARTSSGSNTVITIMTMEYVVFPVEKSLYASVSGVYLSPYLNSLGRHDDEFFPSSVQYDQLEKSLPDDKRIDFKKVDFSDKKKTYLDIQACSGGKLGLVIFDDGSVSICERLMKGTVTVGNVLSNTISEVWNSNELLSLVQPDREYFTETECYDCEHFEECVKEKGICYVRTRPVNGRLFSLDPYCPKAAGKYRMM